MKGSGSTEYNPRLLILIRPYRRFHPTIVGICNFVQPSVLIGGATG